MSRQDIIRKLKLKHKDLSINQIEAIINTFSASISDALKSEKNIELRNFGTFFLKEIKEKKYARNPKTGELIYVPKKNKIRFKMSKNLKEKLNQN